MISSVFLKSFLILLNYHLFDLGSSKKVTVFDNFCDSSKIYTPYIKYYKGRLDATNNAKPFNGHGRPGFYNDFNGLNDVYVCINGPAWLYYLTIPIKEHGITVYSEPELHNFVHHCFIANESPGPEAKTRTMLEGILLMGNEQDYRKPSITLLKAPFKKTDPNPTNSIPTNGSTDPIPTNSTTDPIPTNGTTNLKVPDINATSLIMFGTDTECILLKGKGTEIRIRTKNEDPSALPTPAPTPTTATTTPVVDPPEEPHEDPPVTFCKLSYGNLADNLNPDSSGAVAAPELEYALEALKNNEEFRTKGCYIHEEFNEVDYHVVKERIKAIEKLGPKSAVNLIPDKVWNEGDAYFKDALKDNAKIQPNVNPSQFWPRVDKCGWTTTPIENTCDDEEVEKAIKTLHEEIEKEKKTHPSDKEKIKRWEFEINEKRIQLCISSAIVNANELKSVFEKLKAKWDELEKNMNDNIIHKYFTTTPNLAIHKEEMEAAKKKLDSNPKNDTLITEYNTKKTEYEKEVQEYKQATLKLAPDVSKAESLREELKYQFKRTNASYSLLTKQVKSWASGGRPTCSSKDLKPQLNKGRPGLITIKRDEKDYLLNNDPNDKTRFFDPEPAGLNAAKDNKRTCGKLKKGKDICTAGKPVVERACTIFRARQGKTPAAGLPKMEWKSQDAWRKEVLDLIQDIFSNGCNRLKKDFAIGVNNIMMGYLTGNIPLPEGKAVDLKPKDPTWNNFIQSMKKCKAMGIKLSFQDPPNGALRGHSFGNGASARSTLKDNDNEDEEKTTKSHKKGSKNQTTSIENDDVPSNKDDEKNSHEKPQKGSQKKGSDKKQGTESSTTKEGDDVPSNKKDEKKVPENSQKKGSDKKQGTESSTTKEGDDDVPTNKEGEDKVPEKPEKDGVDSSTTKEGDDVPTNKEGEDKVPEKPEKDNPSPKKSSNKKQEDKDVAEANKEEENAPEKYQVPASKDSDKNNESDLTPDKDGVDEDEVQPPKAERKRHSSRTKSHHKAKRSTLTRRNSTATRRKGTGRGPRLGRRFERRKNLRRGVIKSGRTFGRTLSSKGLLKNVSTSTLTEENEGTTTRPKEVKEDNSHADKGSSENGLTSIPKPKEDGGEGDKEIGPKKAKKGKSRGSKGSSKSKSGLTSTSKPNEDGGERDEETTPKDVEKDQSSPKNGSNHTNGSISGPQDPDDPLDPKDSSKNADRGEGNSPIEINIEQADNAFAFNLVIDWLWKMFATVLGLCIPTYDKETMIQFHKKFSEDFLEPLQAEWILNRDNMVFTFVMGEFHKYKGPYWTSMCLEGAYVHSGKVEYRPLRHLKVSGVQENFFTNGTLKGTKGIYGA